MTYKILFSEFIKKHGLLYLIGILCFFIIDGLFLAVPKITGHAIDSISGDRSELTYYIVIFLVVVILITLLKFFSRHLLLGSIRHFEYYLRETIFKHALQIPISYYEKNGPGKVMALMTNDVTSLRVALGLGLMIIIDAVFYGIFAFIIMSFETSFTLTAITLSPMLLIVGCTLYVTKYMRTAQREAQNTFSEMTEFVQELFLGIHVIRAFNKEAKSVARFSRINETNYERNMRVALLDSFITPLTFIAPFACFAVNIYICGMLAAAGKITVGDFVALNGYLILIIGPLMGLGSLATITQKGLASIDRITAFFDEPEELSTSDSGILALSDLHIKNLSFEYQGTSYAAINNITMNIPAGSFVGLVGGPGSGKSTLFKLLLRLQETPKQSIYFGEKDCTTIPLEVLRRSVAYVPPVPYILSASIQDNISFGEASEHSIPVEEAAQRAYLNMDLAERVKSTDSKLKEGGRDLSGGQQQRVNIARGLFKNAPYLLLDDSFSALDFNSAGEVLQHLRKDEPQTILFISQRLEALVGADIIYVFKDGAICESGNHASLLDRKGEYYRLYMQQRIDGGKSFEE